MILIQSESVAADLRKALASKIKSVLEAIHAARVELPAMTDAQTLHLEQYTHSARAQLSDGNVWERTGGPLASSQLLRSADILEYMRQSLSADDAFKPLVARLANPFAVMWDACDRLRAHYMTISQREVDRLLGEARNAVAFHAEELATHAPEVDPGIIAGMRHIVHEGPALRARFDPLDLSSAEDDLRRRMDALEAVCSPWPALAGSPSLQLVASKVFMGRYKAAQESYILHTRSQQLVDTAAGTRSERPRH